MKRKAKTQSEMILRSCGCQNLHDIIMKNVNKCYEPTSMPHGARLISFRSKLIIETRLTGIPMSSQSAAIVFKRRDFDELSVCANYK